MDYHLINPIVAQSHLQIMGGFYPRHNDPVPAGTRTVLMLGPIQTTFWSFVTSSIEFLDGKPDPLDRWSRRIIAGIAKETKATAMFPFGGPPYLPFFEWAIRTGRCWTSPVQLLVHDTAGLLISFRGALAIAERIELPPTESESPCESCMDRPCTTRCPVHALAEGHYDAQTCIDYVSDRAGIDCLANGCAVRRACPLSVNAAQPPAQAHFHQEARIGRKG